MNFHTQWEQNAKNKSNVVTTIEQISGRTGVRYISFAKYFLKVVVI